MRTFNIEAAMKYTLWEEAKGKLRALVCVQGSYESANLGEDDKFELLGEQVELFIKSVEDEGLQE